MPQTSVKNCTERSLTIVFEELFCFECCIPFFAPIEMVRHRSKNEQPIHCPGCGAKNDYGYEPVDKAPSIEDRQQQIKELHDAEQSEAKIAELQAELDALRGKLAESKQPEKPHRRRKSV